MDPTFIANKFSEQGILVFAMACVIAYLIYENRALKAQIKELNSTFLTTLRETITLTNTVTSQVEAFKSAITTMTTSIASWREEMLRGKREP